jgi:replicative DNA helicase
MDDGRLLHAAIGYTKKKRPVFPVHSVIEGRCSCGDALCRHPAKHPRSSRGFLDATTDELQIREWWTQWPDARIGLTTGKGLFVLDIDPRHGGDKTLHTWEEVNGSLPLTVEARTPSGGRHLYFLTPENMTVRSGTNVLGPGVDVRGVGGYVVAPPSPGYEWIANGTGLETPPEALLRELFQTGRGNDHSTAIPDPIPQGQRNATLASLAGSMRRRGIGESVIRVALKVVNAEQCKPPLSEGEVDEIGRSVSRYPAGADETEGEATGEWPKPVPLNRPIEVAPFPVDALPSDLRAMVEAVAQSRQVPVDLPAMLGLGVIAACGSNRIRVQMNESYSEPLNLYVVAALFPGERKSSTFADMTAPLIEAEKRRREEAAPRIRAEKEKWEINEEQRKKLRRDIARQADPEERSRLSSEAEVLAKGMAEPPSEPRLLVSDATPEKVASLMASNNGRLAQMDAEGGCFFNIIGGRYSDLPNFDVYLRGHSGDAFCVDRMGRSESIKNPGLTLVLTIQPGILIGFSKTPEFRNRGLLARFLYAVPSSRVGSRKFVNAGIPRSVADRYTKTIDRLLAVPDPPLSSVSSVSNSEKADYTLLLSAEAERVWIDNYERAERMMADRGSLSHIRDWAGKLPGTVLRIAGCLHLVDQPRTPWKTRISRKTMAAAWRIGEYLTCHALAAFALMFEPPAITKARRILRWMLEGGLARFTRRDSYRALSPSQDPEWPVEGLKRLEDWGYVRSLLTRQPTPQND